MSAPPSLVAHASTPALLRLALGTIALLALTFFLAVRAAVNEHRHAMKTIGKDTAPSILAAQAIRADLADMHSNAANVLLHRPGEGKQALADYEKRRVAATEGILAAAGNITYDEAERGPLRTVLNALGRYEAAVAEAFVLHRRGSGDALAAHREADRVMSETILPAADALDRVNRAEMDRVYAGVRGASLRAILVVVLAGLVLLALLGAVQVFLYQRMRRILNPALAAASLLTFVFLVVAVATFFGQRRALKTAKEDAFDSIHALWRARALAYDANGDESRWLLDRARGAAYEKDFVTKVGRLMKLPAGTSPSQLVAAAKAGTLPADCTGYLADELRNITFAGEREAALATLETFARYVDVDEQIRKREGEGKHAAAVALCLGEREGESNWAFARFDEALGKTLDINQKEFDAAVKGSLDRLAPFDSLAPVVALAVAALAVVGLWPRMREYAAG